MVEAIYVYGLEKALIYHSIREQVFIKEQQVPLAIEQDGQDKQAFHVIVYHDDCQPIATGRLLLLKNGVAQLGRIAVLDAYRGKKYGSLVVQMLLSKAFDIGCQIVLLHAQVSVRSFYDKMGFEERGDVFTEAGIEHIEMVIDKNAFFSKKNCCSKSQILK